MSSGPFRLWVICAGFVMSVACPVYPQQQTFPNPDGLSHMLILDEVLTQLGG